jgi:hypothetical protein
MAGLFTGLSVCLSDCLSVCLFVCLSVYPDCPDCLPVLLSATVRSRSSADPGQQPGQWTSERVDTIILDAR